MIGGGLPAKRMGDMLTIPYRKKSGIDTKQIQVS